MSGVQGIMWACCWRSGATREGAGRPAWCRACGAQQLLDRMSAGSAPTIAGKVRGQEQGVRVGEGLGDTCKLQDMRLHGFMALGHKVGMWWT